MANNQYNPLDKRNLGKSVAEALLDQHAHALDGLQTFDGAGIYAIYYKGPFPAYQLLSSRNADAPKWPIYIGKAIPAGGRKGAAIFAVIAGQHLWKRLREHAESIRLAENLDLADFQCRYLVIDDIWIPLGETLLITHFKPVWNLSLEGFGNHDPGSGRYGGLRPLWDVLHPGRQWALKCKQRLETPTDAAKIVTEFLRANEPSGDPHMKFNSEWSGETAT